MPSRTKCTNRVREWNRCGEARPLYEAPVTAPWKSVERAQPVPNIGEIRISDAELFEQCSGLGNLAAALVEIGQRIGASQMMVSRSLREAPTLFEELRGLHDLAPISQRTRHHDATLADEFSSRRHLTKFKPELFNLGPLTQRPVAIGENRILLGGIGQQAEGFELACSRLPLLLAIEGYAVELADRGNGWSLVGQLFQNARCVAEAIGLEVLGRFGETTLDPFAPRATNGFAQLFPHFPSEIDGSRIASTLRGALHHGVLAHVFDKHPLLGGARIASGTPFGVSQFGGNRIGDGSGPSSR